jgi:hypothetical protein
MSRNDARPKPFTFAVPYQAFVDTGFGTEEVEDTDRNIPDSSNDESFCTE